MNITTTTTTIGSTTSGTGVVGVVISGSDSDDT